MKRLISLLFVLPTLIFSQIDGTINGYIYDSKSQLPLLGANVIIEGTDKGAISDENGFFEISKITVKSITNDFHKMSSCDTNNYPDTLKSLPSYSTHLGEQKCLRVCWLNLSFTFYERFHYHSP